ncbi:protein-ADP-ribose hydrolase [Streptomyces humi]
MSHPEPLPLTAYRDAVRLDEPFRPTAPPATPDQIPSLTRTALRLLEKEDAAAWTTTHGPDLDWMTDEAARRLLRTALTVRAPAPLSPETTAALDALLAGESRQRPGIRPSTLPTVAETHPDTTYPAADRTILWRGDITTLAADAIVNAANDALLGCFVPMHPCVDNAIHAAAGPRLREDCDTIMSLQGTREPTGTAKITRGYHLPARHVLHTVGPVVDGPLRPGHEEALARAYRSCLDLAADTGTIRTLGLCAISTGVFGYPKAQAARLALRTVADWLTARPGRLDLIVFTVFTDEDHALYRQALAEEAPLP